MPTIEYCRQQQAECRAKLETNGWDEFTALGLSDWMHEEIILLREERESFEQEYRAEFKRTVNFIRRWTTMHGIDPEDIAQSAWTRAWEKRAMYLQDAKFATWVMAIALNMFRCRLRKYDPLRCHFQIDGTLAYEFHFGDPLAMRTIAREFPEELAVLEAFYFEDKGQPASHLSSPRVKVMRAKRKIRKRLGTVREIRKVGS